MASRTFSVALRRFAEKAGRNADLVVQRAALDMFGRIVLRTPVDTGRARGNWFLTIGAPSSAATTNVSPSGAGPIAAATATLAGFRSGPSIWFANNLPYAQRLEYGWSQRSPNGMVRITMREYRGIFAAAAGGIRR